MNWFRNTITLDLTINKDDIYYPLLVNHIHQCMNEWCWAACGSMFHNFHQNDIPKKLSLYDFVRLKNRNMNYNHCDRIDSHYNEPIKPYMLNYLIMMVQPNFKLYGKTSDRKFKSTLKEQPIIMGIDYNNGGIGHFIIVSGYNEKDKTLYINNPFYNGVLEISWDYFFGEGYYTTGQNSSYWKYTGMNYNN